MGRRDKGEERRIAAERIDRLLALADAAVRAGRPDRAARYGELAWRIKTTYQVRGSGVERRLCRACHAFLAGPTMRVRYGGGKRSVTCLACGEVRRRPLRPRRT